MDSKVLVTYASQYGATQEIAEKIGAVLRQAGLQADVISVDRVRDLTPYLAVILGSSVYIGQWNKKAAEFLKANEKSLSDRRVWLFPAGQLVRAIRWNCWKAGACLPLCSRLPIASIPAT